jgi:hypothetical protein
MDGSLWCEGHRGAISERESPRYLDTSRSLTHVENSSKRWIAEIRVRISPPGAIESV